MTLQDCRRGALALAVLVAAASQAVAAPRVVSVNIASDEILLELIPERLLAVSLLADDPGVSNAVGQAAAVPLRVKADPEQILALRPDVVAIGAEKVHVVETLEALGVSVVRIQGFESIAWVERLIRALGEAVGARARAEAMIRTMRGRLDAVRARVAGASRPGVLTYSPWGGTAGAGTLFDELLGVAGGRNLAAERGISGFKRMSLEQVVMADPEVIVFNGHRRWAPGFRDAFLAHPALRGLRAFREHRVHELPGRLMVAASQHVAVTAEALAAVVHPRSGGPSR
jgi:iron complex transport system substrate-binding protein